MSVLTIHGEGGYLHFDEAECRAKGREFADSYQHAEPFPHIAIDDFLDKALLRSLVAEFPSNAEKSAFDRSQERLKYQFHPNELGDRRTRNLLAELNSQAFLGFLEEMTGIKGLVGDPLYAGGGLHEIKRGGHLSVHADFNVHDQIKMERRLNLLVYLNDDWDEEYGGFLELWDKGMKQAERKIAPHLGRAVVFSTTLESFHGHPEPLNCPPERTRRSIATYYYTAFEGGIDTTPRNTTFKPRPGSTDKPDRRVGYDHFVTDWVPPRMQRIARRLNPFSQS